MADMNFKVNLLPNSTTKEYSLGSSTKRWNIYGDLTGDVTGYSSNLLSWDSDDKKLQQINSSSTASTPENLLTFSAGNGINLTATNNSLTIAAKTTLVNPPTASAAPSTYGLGLAEQQDNTGNLYKTTSIVTIFMYVANTPITRLQIGNDEIAGQLALYNPNTLNGATLMSVANRANDTTFYLPDYAGNVYLTHVASTGKVGSTTQPVYVDTNGRITAATSPVLGISWDSNSKKIQETIGSSTTDVVTQQNLQSAIYVISDSEPLDHSVLWLKPITA